VDKREFVKSRVKSIFLISLVLIGVIYFSSYLWIRLRHTEIWEKDGNAYVIFPDDKIFLYYFYRPLSYFDGTITGMKFHIGQHK
jgi:hypothetical protein